MKRFKAFTLIELLVVISIIALLMSIMMPALGKARQLAKNTICKTNLKQIGYAVALYAQDNNNSVVVSWTSSNYSAWASNPDRNTSDPDQNNFAGFLSSYVGGKDGEVEGGLSSVSGKSQKIWKCPSYKRDPAATYQGNWSYGMNRHLSFSDQKLTAYSTKDRSKIEAMRMDRIKMPDNKILVADVLGNHCEFGDDQVGFVIGGMRHSDKTNTLMANLSIDYDYFEEDASGSKKLVRHPELRPFPFKRD